MSAPKQNNSLFLHYKIGPMGPLIKQKLRVCRAHHKKAPHEAGLQIDLILEEFT